MIKDENLRMTLQTLDAPQRASAADQVFDALYRQIVTLELEPMVKVSETEVARQTGVSRQPVRDAFYRLSQLGFLTIRPQRATTVTPISAKAVLQARFVRTALEVETVRVAATGLSSDGLDLIDAHMEQQEKAVDRSERERFHALDDGFHRLICELSGVGFAWALIRESKAHMDRVRYLSLAFGARSAFEDHQRILEALRRRDPDLASAAMRKHLSKIEQILAQIRAENGRYFAEERA